MRDRCRVFTLNFIPQFDNKPLCRFFSDSGDLAQKTDVSRSDRCFERFNFDVTNDACCCFGPDSRNREERFKEIAFLFFEESIERVRVLADNVREEEKDVAG